MCLPVPIGLWKDNPIKEQNKASLTTQTVSDRSQPLTVDFTRQHNETVGCFIYNDANLKGLCLCITSCRPVVNHSSMFLWPWKEVQHKEQLIEPSLSEHALPLDHGMVCHWRSLGMRTVDYHKRSGGACLYDKGWTGQNQQSEWITNTSVFGFREIMQNKYIFLVNFYWVNVCFYMEWFFNVLLVLLIFRELKGYSTPKWNFCH